MITTMSVVTDQPRPFGLLEREKHIEMIIRTLQKKNGTSCECLVESAKPHIKSTCWESQERLSGNSKKQKDEEKRFAGAPENDLSVLDLIEQFHVNARPELQGPHCVPRRIYSISANSDRLDLLVAIEESSCLSLQCCGPARVCSLKGIDCEGRQVFYFERPFRTDACCLGCCLMEMRIYTAQKQLIGTVCQRKALNFSNTRRTMIFGANQASMLTSVAGEVDATMYMVTHWSMFTPLLEVCDASGESTLRLQGPCCPCRCVSNQEFQIMSNTGEKIGSIWKKWPGFSLQQNMDHEYFGLNVPQIMKPETKLILLGATFLLSYMYFEMS